ncbi:MAG: rod shape-determining protein MreD [Myxococcales bacterium]|nr:rod shape-determining protein MreD [Myxococcales bacterium]
MSPTRAFLFCAVGWFGLILVSSAQAAWPIDWPWHIPGPDLALLVVLYLGLSDRGGLVGVAVVALLLGWLADLFAGSPKGLYMTVYILLGLAARGASVRLMVRGAFFTAAVALFFALAVGVLVVGLRTSLQPTLGWGALRQVPLASLMTALFAPPLFFLLRRLDKRIQQGSRAHGRAAGQDRLA